LIPNPTGERTLRTRAAMVGWDGASFLTAYVVLLMALPSRLVIGPLGAGGTLANVVAVAGAVWWLWARAADLERTPTRAHPVRTAMIVFVVCVTVSYIAAVTRAIGGDEVSTANTGMLLVAGWLGVVLVADSGIANMDRLEVLMRRMAIGGGLIAVLGLMQFATGRAYTDLIQIPGLTTNATLTSVVSRDSYFRPSGTALHPIEFGVAMNILLPICLHVALTATDLSKFRRWFPVVAIAMAIPLSISRSAIVGVVVVLAVLLPTWERRMRIGGLIFSGVTMVMVFLIVPGMLGTITKLFTGISNDASALSRTDSYSTAWEFISRSPAFGRGFQTFLPSYRILDNQYLGLLIETGFVGVLALLGLFLTAIATAFVARSRFTDVRSRSAAAALAASVAAPATCLAFVDGFSFPLMAGLTFLSCGLIGTVYAHSVTERPRP
jgi:O-antigen ligase